VAMISPVVGSSWGGVCPRIFYKCLDGIGRNSYLRATKTTLNENY